VAARLVLHDLPGPKRAGALAALVERLYLDGRRVVVWFENEELAETFDEYLWTFRKLSFVPHRVWRGGGEMEDPVVLVTAPANPNRADVLVVGDAPPPGEWAASFAEVHDLLPPGEAGAARRAAWEGWRRAVGS